MSQKDGKKGGGKSAVKNPGGDVTQVGSPSPELLSELVVVLARAAARRDAKQPPKSDEQLLDRQAE